MILKKFKDKSGFPDFDCGLASARWLFRCGDLDKVIIEFVDPLIGNNKPGYTIRLLGGDDFDYLLQRQRGGIAIYKNIHTACYTAASIGFRDVVVRFNSLVV